MLWLEQREVSKQYQFRTTYEHSLSSISSEQISGTAYVFLLVWLIAGFQQWSTFTTEMFYMSHSFPMQRIWMFGNLCHSADAILTTSLLWHVYILNNTLTFLFPCRKLKSCSLNLSSLIPIPRTKPKSYSVEYLTITSSFSQQLQHCIPSENWKGYDPL